MIRAFSVPPGKTLDLSTLETQMLEFTGTGRFDSATYAFGPLNRFMSHTGNARTAEESTTLNGSGRRISDAALTPHK